MFIEYLNDKNITLIHATVEYWNVSIIDDFPSSIVHSVT